MIGLINIWFKTTKQELNKCSINQAQINYVNYQFFFIYNFLNVLYVIGKNNIHNNTL